MAVNNPAGPPPHTTASKWSIVSAEAVASSLGVTAWSDMEFLPRMESCCEFKGLHSIDCLHNCGCCCCCWVVVPVLFVMESGWNANAKGKSRVGTTTKKVSTRVVEYGSDIGIRCGWSRSCAEKRDSRYHFWKHTVEWIVLRAALEAIHCGCDRMDTTSSYRMNHCAIFCKTLTLTNNGLGVEAQECHLGMLQQARSCPPNS